MVSSHEWLGVTGLDSAAQSSEQIDKFGEEMDNKYIRTASVIKKRWMSASYKENLMEWEENDWATLDPEAWKGPQKVTSAPSPEWQGGAARQRSGAPGGVFQADGMNVMIPRQEKSTSFLLPGGLASISAKASHLSQTRPIIKSFHSASVSIHIPVFN